MRAARNRKATASGAALLWLLAAGAARADTVYLKDGGVIKDCRITGEEGGKVLLRTPGGRMGVPQEVVARIEKEKSLFDEYDAKRAAVNQYDYEGLFKLAQWCREAGLREELSEILLKVVERRKEHAQARRLLGYYKADGEWKLPPPLELRLALAGEKDHGGEVPGQLSIVLSIRKDVVLVREKAQGKNPEKEAKAAPPAKGPDACDLTISVVTGESPEATFYGQKVLGPAAQATVSLTAVGEFLAGKPLALTLRGEVPASVRQAKKQALIDAFTRSAKELHDYFDQATEARLKALDSIEERRKKATASDQGQAKAKTKAKTKAKAKG